MWWESCYSPCRALGGWHWIHLYIGEDSRHQYITPFFQSLTNNKEQKKKKIHDAAHCHELCKSVSIMIVVNLALAFVNLLLKKLLNEGMDYMSIITYRQATSFIFMAPIACIYERQEPISFIIILFDLHSQAYLEEKKLFAVVFFFLCPLKSAYTFG